MHRTGLCTRASVADAKSLWPKSTRNYPQFRLWFGMDSIRPCQYARLHTLRNAETHMSHELCRCEVRRPLLLARTLPWRTFPQTANVAGGALQNVKHLRRIGVKKIVSFDARMKVDPPPPIRALRLPEVMRITGLGRSTIYRLIVQGLFPRQIRLSARAVAWTEEDVSAWLATRRRN